MANSKIELRGYFEALLDGSFSVAPTPMVNSSSPSEVQTAILTVGDNISTPAPGSKGVLISLPVASTSAQVRTLKSTTTDTGFPLPGTEQFIVLPLDPTNLPAAIIITVTSSDDTAPTSFRYF